MRRTVLLLVTMALTLLVASGVALALNKVGTNGPDTLRGTNRPDNLVGLGGNDDLFALGGNDNLLGGPGRDNVLGGNEFAPGASGGDKNLMGGPGNDRVFGGSGSDTIVGGEGNDFLVDSPYRRPSKDKLFGENGNDVIDVLSSPAVKDVVVCGNGFDRVLADRADLVAPDCERVFVGFGPIIKFYRDIPQSFYEGLPPYPGHVI
jgi:Ca2+-binding RTX toxin-like protein